MSKEPGSLEKQHRDAENQLIMVHNNQSINQSKSEFI